MRQELFSGGGRHIPDTDIFPLTTEPYFSSSMVDTDGLLPGGFTVSKWPQGEVLGKSTIVTVFSSMDSQTFEAVRALISPSIEEDDRSFDKMAREYKDALPRVLYFPGIGFSFQVAGETRLSVIRGVGPRIYKGTALDRQTTSVSRDFRENELDQVAAKGLFNFKLTMLQEGRDEAKLGVVAGVKFCSPNIAEIDRKIKHLQDQHVLCDGTMRDIINPYLEIKPCKIEGGII